jgi:hypothetical protein
MDGPRGLLEGRERGHWARVKGEGPQLVVARLLRLCGHGEHDDAPYIDPKLKQSQLAGTVGSPKSFTRKDG